MTFPTADLCDAHADRLQIAEPLFTDFGDKLAFAGPISTVKCFEDNSLLGEALEQAGEGRALVVDGGGSERCALLGDNLAQLAIDNNWAGMLVFGCVRDTAELGELPMAVKALAAYPRKSDKRGQGQRDVPVRFAGVTFRPGHWLYADTDGVIVAETELTL